MSMSFPFTDVSHLYLHVIAEQVSNEWHDRKGVTITARPLTPERQLKDLLVNRLNLNSQIDAVDFANFIIALSLIEGFDTAPWPVRADTMYNYTGKYVAESTLRGWASKLIATGNAIKEGKDGRLRILVEFWHNLIRPAGLLLPAGRVCLWDGLTLT